MVKKARAAGSFLGGIANNPGVIILGLALGALFIFRDRISEAFAGIGEGLVNIEFPKIEFPDITFPEFPKIEFPDITFPEFPDFTDIFQGFQDQLSALAGQTVAGQGEQTIDIPPDTTVNPDGTVSSTTPPISTDPSVAPANLDPLGEIAFNQLKSQTITSLINQGFDQFKVFERFQDVSFFDSDKPFKFLGSILEEFNPPFTPPDQPAQDFGTTVIQSLGTPQVFTGGGVGFQGGSVSPTPITTLTQVLDLFPELTASQAADFLGEFSGILPEAALLQGGDVINLSGDPSQPQTFNQSSLGISGTPEQLFALLFPNIISNF